MSTSNSSPRCCGSCRTCRFASNTWYTDREASRNRRGKDMTVVGVGKAERGNQRLVSGDQAIRRCLIHEVLGAFQRCATAARFASQQGIDPLTVNVAAPFRTKDILDRQLQASVP